MYLHLGKDISILEREVIGIFDMDTSTSSRHTRNFLKDQEARGNIEAVSDEIPKSMIVCSDKGKSTVYISQISSQTLLKRAQGDDLPDNVI